MKLNPDCIRDILFFLEENLSLSPSLDFQVIDYQSLCEALHYPAEEVVNTLIVLDEADFIEIAIDRSSSGIEELDVYRITYEGYQFLETIRPEPVWKKVKTVGSGIGSFSIDLITRVASSVIASLVNGQLNL